MFSHVPSAPKTWIAPPSTTPRWYRSASSAPRAKYRTWAAWQRPGEAATLWVGRPYDVQQAGQGQGNG
jgi:hypothetical protein